MRGFSGHFPPFQLLFLWDLVLAYDSMEVYILDFLEASYHYLINEDRHFEVIKDPEIDCLFQKHV